MGQNGFGSKWVRVKTGRLYKKGCFGSCRNSPRRGLDVSNTGECLNLCACKARLRHLKHTQMTESMCMRLLGNVQALTPIQN
ncbi:hypothetical protein Hanom_Chr05g00467931 [Helianthus anomalus]